MVLKTESHTFAITHKVPKSHTSIMATCVALKHPVTTLLTAFTNPIKLTNDPYLQVCT